MKKMSFTLFRSSRWLSASFLVLFAWCLVGSVNAQTALNASNDTSVDGRACDHAGNTFSVCTGAFTDDGGAGLYNDAAGPLTWTFCPDVAMNNRVRLTFSEFDVAAGDVFTVTNGPCGGDCQAAESISLSGNSVGGMGVSAAANAGGTLAAGAGWVEATCSNISGCITVEFAPTNDGNKGTGWNFDVSCLARDAGINVPDVILPKACLLYTSPSPRDRG